VVGENGNLIVIGRSGTGKTLLSILRLYAMEFLKKQAKVY
jgi:KaiC/GvpD/RAD55 family RecA-like ATPase